MTITCGKRVVFIGGFMKLSGFAVKLLIRRWRAANTNDIIRIKGG
jgi:hypothetical protein